MQWRLASTPVAKVDHATGDMEGTLVSRGRNTPVLGELLEVRHAAVAHVLRDQAGIHPVETQHHDASTLGIPVGVPDGDEAVEQPERPGEDDRERDREGDQQDGDRTHEREAGPGPDVRVGLGSPDTDEEQREHGRQAPGSVGYHALVLGRGGRRQAAFRDTVRVGLEPAPETMIRQPP